MRYFFFISFVFTISITSISCSNPVLFENNIISISKNDSLLKITNRDDNTIFYFIIEQNAAALIDWVPSTKVPIIPGGSAVTIKYSEIEGLQNLTVKKDTKVIFYYWHAPNHNLFDVKNVVINL